MTKRQYWGFRISTRWKGYPEYYNEQLKDHKVLRQGWGWEGTALKGNKDPLPNSVKPNLRMLEVKAGDIILIPRLPEWGFVLVAEATEDWDDGYQFEIDEKLITEGWLGEGGDFGHKFPAKQLTYFNPHNKHVDSSIRRTLKCRGRFWNLDGLGKFVEKLRDKTHDELTSYEDRKKRFKNVVSEQIRFENIGEKIRDGLSSKFQGEGWEYGLVAGLKALFPNYKVTREGGKAEAKHGTDVLITMPGLLEGRQYGIAIQVKDWQGIAGGGGVKGAIEQIKKVGEEWKKSDESEVIEIVEKILVITEAKLEEGQGESLEEGGVRILYGEEFKRLLFRMALAIAATGAITEE